MSDSIVEKNIARHSYDRFYREDGGRVCLLGLLGAELDDYELEAKRQHILEKLEDGWSERRVARLCTIGTCEVSVVDDLDSGRTINGECVATTYCLKEKFEESGDATKPPEERKKIYRAIMDTCLGHADKYSAGNFCPRLDCELSAGFSIDGAGGTAGECVVEIRAPQQQLDFGNVN